MREKLKTHERIMLDTAPIIYFIEEHPDFGPISDEIFQTIRNEHRIYAFTSIITLIEVLAQPFRTGDEDLAETYRRFLCESSNFTLYDIDGHIAEQAAALRGNYEIRTPDAIQLATGIVNEATLFITNDKRLKRIKEIEVLSISDYPVQ